MPDLHTLISDLIEQGVDVFLDDGKLKARALQGMLKAEHKALIAQNKEGLISLLSDPSYQLNIKKIAPKIVKSKNKESLSFSQQRLWFIDQLQSGSPEYNMPTAFEFSGDIDLEIIRQSLAVIIERHEVLRTVYVDDGDSVLQRILAKVDFNLTTHDLTALAKDEQQEKLQSLIEKDIRTPFNLREDLMMRASVILLSHACSEAKPVKQGVLLFNMHHIASDGWSVEILTKEFFSLYQAFIAGQPCPLIPLEIQYGDYACWQRQWLQGEILEEQLRYWDEQLAGITPLHNLELDKPRPEVKQHAGAVVTGRLSAKISASLQQLAKSHQLTPFMLMHSALALVLSRHSNSEDIVIGTPVANRMRGDLEPLIGFFVNTLVLRLNTGFTLLNDYLAHVRQVHQDAQSYQDVPFEQLVERLNIPRNTAHTPLFQVMLSTSSDYGLNNADKEVTFALPGVSLSPLSSDIITAKFDLDIQITLNEQGGFIRWVFDEALFTSEHVEQFNDHLCRLLAGLAASFDEQQENPPIHDLPMLSGNETTYLLETINPVSKANYSNGICIHELFEQSAQNKPNDVALVFEEHNLTFAQLNEEANRLAHYLIEQHNIVPDTRVGICLERSAEMVIAILAILKAGGAYLPLDPNYPKARLEYILTDAGVEVVLTQQKLCSVVNFSACALVFLDGKHQDVDTTTCFSHYPTANIDKAGQGLTSSHLAYVIYTSGSTGQPKGVSIAHSSAAALADELSSWAVCGNNQIWGWFANYIFDASVQGLLRLMCGQQIVVLPDYVKTDPELLVQQLQEHQIQVLDCTPTMVSLWFDAGIEQALPNLIIGGEAISQSLWLKLVSWQQREQTMAVNVYGPTEACVNSTCALIQGEQPTIGRPLDYVTAYVLDPQMNLVPANAIGELHLGGQGLARGYLNNPQLSAACFVDSPYYDAAKGKSSQRLYKTGDLVRYLPDGKLEFIARVDEQVKIRGFRIEPGEIECQLNRHHGVDSTLVLPQNVGADGLQLVAYVKYALTSWAVQSIDTDEEKHNFIVDLKQKLLDELPEYMVPGAFIILDDWPRTPNGKLDKKALPAADGTLVRGEYLAPETETEEALVQIWSTLLNTERENISTSANFFELGGHSLMLVKLLSRVKAHFGINVGVKDLFEQQTIKALAELISEINYLDTQGLDDEMLEEFEELDL